MLELAHKVAVTGGVCSGKTTVTRLFGQKGAHTVSCDEIVHKLLATDAHCINQTVELLGSDILTNGKIDRAKVAKAVFNNEEKLQALESIIHPLVLGEIEQTYGKVGKDVFLFVVEVPLLYEAKWESKFDKTIAVVTSDDHAIERYGKKGRTEKDYWSRQSHLIPSREKAMRADYVIFNDGTLDELDSQVDTIVHELEADNNQ